MLRRMTSSTRSSPKSTMTRTTRNLLKRALDHDPHSMARAARIKGMGVIFRYAEGFIFRDEFHREDELRTDLTDVDQTLLLRTPGSRAEYRRFQTQVGVPQARNEMASGQESELCL